ncbi:hypothetical protein GGI17_006767 [Coemansia sp. S146]|nr:hypothetical protein GGI17_006767 [Coemansia sp. S146]
MGFCSDIADDNADAGEYSFASPNVYSSHAPWEACYSDLSPSFNSAAAVATAAPRIETKPSLSKEGFLFPQLQAEARSMWSLNEPYGSGPTHGMPVQPHRIWHNSPNDAAAFTSPSHFPVVFKPRPVAPHVFFELDGTALNGGGRDSSSSNSNSNSALGVSYASVYEQGDDMAEDVVVVRDEYEDEDADSDCSGESPHFETIISAAYNYSYYMTK